MGLTPFFIIINSMISLSTEESNQDKNEKKILELKGTNNRYQMKKVMKVKEPIKNRKVSEKWALNEEDTTYEKQIELLSLLLQKKADFLQSFPLCKTILQEIERKLASYQKQDTEKKRYNSDLFISYEQTVSLLDDIQCKCHYCKEKVILLYEKVREKKQWTLDRIDNDLGHNKDNVVIACLECNLKRRRQSKDGFLFTKQLTIVKQEKDLSNSNDTA